MTARVQDTTVPAAGPRDELKLSKADRAAQAKAQAQAEAEVASQRKLKDAESKLAQLEKNVTDMQRLMELKNAEIAKLNQCQGGSGPGCCAGHAGGQHRADRGARRAGQARLTRRLPRRARPRRRRLRPPRQLHRPPQPMPPRRPQPLWLQRPPLRRRRQTPPHPPRLPPLPPLWP